MSLPLALWMLLGWYPGVAAALYLSGRFPQIARPSWLVAVPLLTWAGGAYLIADFATTPA